jgi:hypothetical protein
MLNLVLWDRRTALLTIPLVQRTQIFLLQTLEGQMHRAFLIASTFAVILTTAAAADTYVRGYTRSDGTYVQPHHRTNPDGNRFNNYGTQGNINPYTGERGTVNPYRAPNPYGSNSLNPGGGLYGGQRRY